MPLKCIWKFIVVHWVAPAANTSRLKVKQNSQASKLELHLRNYFCNESNVSLDTDPIIDRPECARYARLSSDPVFDCGGVQGHPIGKRDSRGLVSVAKKRAQMSRSSGPDLSLPFSMEAAP